MKAIHTAFAAAAAAALGLSLSLPAHAGALGQAFEAGVYAGPSGSLQPGVVAPGMATVWLNGVSALGDVSASGAATYASATVGAGAEFVHSTSAGDLFEIDIQDTGMSFKMMVANSGTSGDLVVLIDSLNPMLALFNTVVVSDTFGTGGWQILDVNNTSGLSPLSSGQRLAFGVNLPMLDAGTVYGAKIQFEPVLNTAPPTGGTANPVPEPGSLALAGLALAGLARRARRAG